ncbi:MAG: transporter [Rickettsiales bacterium]|jgi:predicted permease|nr:transporter [Rickettsiales bacterium]
MLSIITALAPVFIVIVLGSLFKYKKMPGDEFWPHAEKLTYYVLLPSLFFRNIANASFEGWDVSLILYVLMVTVIIMTALLLLYKRFSSIPGPEFTSVFQGATRFNNYVGIPAAFALFGKDGLALSALLIAMLVPMINSACIAILHYFGSNERMNPMKSLYKIITNPLIVSTAWGGLVNASGMALPSVLDHVLEALSQASLAFGLLCVGAGLDIKATRGKRHVIAATAVVKLLVLPIITALVALALGLEGMSAELVVLYMALPAASSSYIMAKQLGGDAKMMSGILVAQTMFAAITMPLVVIAARAVFTMAGM